MFGLVVPRLHVFPSPVAVLCHLVILPLSISAQDASAYIYKYNDTDVILMLVGRKPWIHNLPRKIKERKDEKPD